MSSYYTTILPSHLWFDSRGTCALCYRRSIERWWIPYLRFFCIYTSIYLTYYSIAVIFTSRTLLVPHGFICGLSEIKDIVLYSDNMLNYLILSCIYTYLPYLSITYVHNYIYLTLLLHANIHNIPYTAFLYFTYPTLLVYLYLPYLTLFCIDTYLTYSNFIYIYIYLTYLSMAYILTCPNLYCTYTNISYFSNT